MNAFTKGMLAASAALVMLSACTQPKKAEAVTTLSGLNPEQFVDSVAGTQLYTLTNSNGMEVCITNFGGRVVSIMVPDNKGEMKDVVLGFDNVATYMDNVKHPSDFGAAIGRYANRIAQGKITVEGQEIQLPKNNFGHCLHGGPQGWQYKVYDVVDVTESTLQLKLVSPDGDNNFPGEVTAVVTYTLTEDNTLDIRYEATTTAPTVINMTNHSYFNLNGDPTQPITNHELYVNADNYTPVDSTFMTTGEIAPVEGTAFDFRQPKPIYKDLEMGGIIGYDHNFMLGEPHVMRTAAIVYDPETGREMTVSTDKPAIQFYTAIGLQGEIGKDGMMMKIQTALCLESQYAPDSPNQPNFPSCVLKKDEEYNFTTIYKFGVRK